MVRTGGYKPAGRRGKWKLVDAWMGGGVGGWRMGRIIYEEGISQIFYYTSKK